MSKKSSKKKIRIDVSADKQSIKTRTDRAKVISTLAPTSPIYQAQPLLQGAVTVLTDASDALAAADAGDQAALMALATARGLRDTRLHEFDAVYDVFTANTEKDAETPEDAAGLGLPVADKVTYSLAPPVGIDAKFDLIKNHIHIHVNRAPGIRTCLVEVSPEPVGDDTWKQLPGVGAVKVLGGYAPGTYWIRAASVRADDRSEFMGPVAVMVK